MKTDKYTITEYTLRDGKVTMSQTFLRTEAATMEYANASTADYVIVNDLENKQIFTKGELPTPHGEVEAKEIPQVEETPIETVDSTPAV